MRRRYLYDTEVLASAHDLLSRFLLQSPASEQSGLFADVMTRCTASLVSFKPDRVEDACLGINGECRSKVADRRSRLHVNISGP